MTKQTDENNLKATGNKAPEPKAAPTATESKPEPKTNEPADLSKDPNEHGTKHEPEVTHVSLQDQGDTASTTTEKSVEEKAEIVARKQDELNSANEEGHARNMEREEERAAHGHHNSHYDRAEHAGETNATHKRVEDNHNTPRVNKDGSKTWI